MEPYLIIFDIDETLYINHESRIPETTLDAISKLKAAGHTLAIATGRAPFELDVVKQLPIEFFILANGQLVLRNEDIIYENPIDIKIINEIMTEARQAGVHIGFNSMTHGSITGITAEVQEIFAKYYSSMPEITKSIDGHEAIYQLWYISEDLTNITEKFGDKLRFIPWAEHGADVIPVGISKAVGLIKALEVLDDVLPEKIVFFGDGINDIELIEMADIGIAMGNAASAVKEVADFVTKNVEDDGIYYACEQLGLFEAGFKDDDEVNTLIAQLEAAIKAKPNVLDNYFELKSLYTHYTKSSAQAAKVLEDALVYFPNNVKLLVELATVYEIELEDYAKAKMYYERVLELAPTHELATNGLTLLNDKSIHPKVKG